VITFYFVNNFYVGFIFSSTSFQTVLAITFGLTLD